MQTIAVLQPDVFVALADEVRMRQSEAQAARKSSPCAGVRA